MAYGSQGSHTGQLDFCKIKHTYENEQNINKIKIYDIILIKGKNLNILSPLTSNRRNTIF